MLLLALAAAAWSSEVSQAPDAPSDATVALELTAATHVGIGTVESIEFRSNGGGTPSAFVSVRISEMLRGPSPEGLVGLRISGGPSADRGFWYDTSTRIHPRDLRVGSVASFAWGRAVDGAHPLVHATQALVARTLGAEGGVCACDGWGDTILTVDPWVTEPRPRGKVYEVVPAPTTDCSGALSWDDVVRALRASLLVRTSADTQP